jgi:selenoprotein W-related protein
LADSIQQSTGIQPELIKGSNGVLEVNLDGETVFSKHATGRFPEEGEVEELLATRLGG